MKVKKNKTQVLFPEDKMLKRMNRRIEADYREQFKPFERKSLLIFWLFIVVFALVAWCIKDIHFRYKILYKIENLDERLSYVESRLKITSSTIEGGSKEIDVKINQVRKDFETELAIIRKEIKRKHR